MENDRMPIDKLRQEMLSGKITYDDIVRRLTQAIESEYLKESPSIDFIDSCEDFLWEIETEGKQKFVSVSDRYLGAIEQHVEITAQEQTKWSPVMGFAKRIALISAAFALLVFFTQGAIHFEWFTQHSSTDEQQYIIQGHEITVNLIETCIAEHDAFDSIKTTSWDELCSFLGFSPHIISPSVFQVDNTLYKAYIEPGVVMVDVLYKTDPHDAVAVMTIHYYTDSSEAYFMFEQDSTGEPIILNNCSIYTSSNMGRTSYAWCSDSTIFKLAGTFSAEQGLQILQYLTGGNNQ